MNIPGQNNLNLHSSFSRFNQSTNQEHNLDMLFKKEKEFKKMIKMKKLKKIEFFNTLHSSFLKDKLNSLYLTDSKRTCSTTEEENLALYRKSTLVKTTARSVNSIETKNNSFVRKTTDEPYSNLKKEREVFNPPRSTLSNKEIKLKVSNKSKIYETLTEFRDKTKLVTFINYSSQKKEDFNIHETYQNDIFHVIDNTNSLNFTQKIFTEFIGKFNLYAHKLAKEKKEEKNNLELLIEKKRLFEDEIRKLEHRAIKIKDSIKTNKEYRNLLVCIKEKKTFEEFTHNLKILEMQASYQPAEKTSNFFRLGKNILIKKKSLKKKKGICSDILILNSLSKFKPRTSYKEIIDWYFHHAYEDNPKIYSDSNQLLKDIKSLECNNLSNLTTLNKLPDKEKVDKELEKLIDEENNDRKVFEEKCEMLNKKLNELKNKNISLKKEINVKSSYTKKNEFLNKKLLEIYNICLSHSNISFLSNISINKKENLTKMDLLHYVEKFTFRCISLYDSIKFNQNDTLIRIEKDIDRERRSNYAKEQQLLKQKKLEKLREKVYEKNNKFYFLPQRKSFGRYKPIEKISKKRFMEKKNEDNLMDYLHYEENSHINE